MKEGCGEKSSDEADGEDLENGEADVEARQAPG
jgi:hypothetical protein